MNQLWGNNRHYKDELKDPFFDALRQFAETGMSPLECKANVEKIKKFLEAIARVEQAVESLSAHPESQSDVKFHNSIISLANLHLMNYHHKLNHWREILFHILSIFEVFNQFDVAKLSKKFR